jgi:hypothetical protein
VGGGIVRIRQVKPEFFADADMAELPIRARLTYIGLWTIADDLGWLPILDAAEIGHALYGYESGKTRARWIIEDLASLQVGGHVEIEPCGHGHIPTLPKHQRVSKDRTVVMHWKSHETQCLAAAIRGIPRSSPEILTGKVGNGRVGNGTVRNGSAREAQDETNDGLRAKLGDFEDVMARPLPVSPALDGELAKLRGDA